MIRDLAWDLFPEELTTATVALVVIGTAALWAAKRLIGARTR